MARPAGAENFVLGCPRVRRAPCSTLKGVKTRFSAESELSSSSLGGRRLFQSHLLRRSTTEGRYPRMGAAPRRCVQVDENVGVAPIPLDRRGSGCCAHGRCSDLTWLPHERGATPVSVARSKRASFAPTLRMHFALREILTEYGGHGDLRLVYKLDPGDRGLSFESTPHRPAFEFSGPVIVEVDSSFDDETALSRVFAEILRAAGLGPGNHLARRTHPALRPRHPRSRRLEPARAVPATRARAQIASGGAARAHPWRDAVRPQRPSTLLDLTVCRSGRERRHLQRWASAAG
jgi:hypothetical protein